MTPLASQVRVLASAVTPLAGSPPPVRIPSGARAPGGRARRPHHRLDEPAERHQMKRVAILRQMGSCAHTRSSRMMRSQDRLLIYRRGDLLPKDRDPLGRAPRERPLAALERRELVTRDITGLPEVLSASVMYQNEVGRSSVLSTPAPSGRPGAKTKWRTRRSCACLVAGVALWVQPTSMGLTRRAQGPETWG